MVRIFTIQVLAFSLMTLSSIRYEKKVVKEVLPVELKIHAPELKPFDPDSLVVIPDGIPIKKSQITSFFGLRKHPILDTVRLHAGIDYAAKVGTPVYATAPGIVIKAEKDRFKSTYGKYIIIDHGEYTTTYAHLSRIHVTEGDIVDDIIGEVGNTGLSKGAHLHYEVRHHGKVINPLDVIE